MDTINPSKFSCRQCGQCCSHIRGMISEEDKEFLNEFAFGKLPLIQVVPVSQMSFPLFGFEAKRFMQWAEESGIDAKIKPSRIVFDLNTNKSIIVTSFMDYDSCPFLKGNKCIIYDKKRAYICRMFPFNRGPFLKTEEEINPEDMFGSCQEMSSIMPLLKNKKNNKSPELIALLKNSLPDELLNAVQFDFIQEWINKTTAEMISSKKIRPAMNHPYEFLLRRIQNAGKVDLMDFLVECGLKTKEEAGKLIERFDSNKDAKEMLDS